MKSYGLGLGVLLAGLVFFIGTREPRRSYLPTPAPLPKLPNAQADSTVRLYQRHPDYLRSLRAIEA